MAKTAGCDEMTSKTLLKMVMLQLPTILITRVISAFVLQYVQEWEYFL